MFILAANKAKEKKQKNPRSFPLHYYTNPTSNAPRKTRGAREDLREKTREFQVD
jgi:hypothetical protein